MTKKPFLTDVWTVPKTALKPIDKDAVTSGHLVGRKAVLKLLNDARAVEFLAHTKKELGLDDMITEQIADFLLDSLANRSHAQYMTTDSLVNMLEENLIVERIAIDNYREMLKHLGDQDPATRPLLESILAVKEKYAAAMADLFGGLPLQPRIA